MCHTLDNTSKDASYYFESTQDLITPFIEHSDYCSCCSHFGCYSCYYEDVLFVGFRVLIFLILNVLLLVIRKAVLLRRKILILFYPLIIVKLAYQLVILISGQRSKIHHQFYSIQYITKVSPSLDYHYGTFYRCIISESSQKQVRWPDPEI